MSDTPGGVPRNDDQLGCGPGQTVSDMEGALLQRIAEYRKEQGGGALGLEVNGQLLLAARDLALRMQGGAVAIPRDAAAYLALFGYVGEAQSIFVLPPVTGLPTAPADPSSLIVGLPFVGSSIRDALRSTDWNEVAATVYGSCYQLGGILVLGSRKAAPGLNP